MPSSSLSVSKANRRPYKPEWRFVSREAAAAAALLTHRLDEIGWTSLPAAPFLAQLVEARLLEGYLDAAIAAASALDEIATTRGRDRVEALAAAAEVVALAEGRADAAPNAARRCQPIRCPRRTPRHGSYPSGAGTIAVRIVIRRRS